MAYELNIIIIIICFVFVHFATALNVFYSQAS